MTSVFICLAKHPTYVSQYIDSLVHWHLQENEINQPIGDVNSQFFYLTAEGKNFT